jgi:hypothetical protein
MNPENCKLFHDLLTSVCTNKDGTCGMRIYFLGCGRREREQAVFFDF